MVGNDLAQEASEHLSKPALGTSQESARRSLLRARGNRKVNKSGLSLQILCWCAWFHSLQLLLCWWDRCQTSEFSGTSKPIAPRRWWSDECYTFQHFGWDRLCQSIQSPISIRNQLDCSLCGETGLHLILSTHSLEIHPMTASIGYPKLVSDIEQLWAQLLARSRNLESQDAKCRQSTQEDTQVRLLDPHIPWCNACSFRSWLSGQLSTCIEPHQSTISDGSS